MVAPHAIKIVLRTEGRRWVSHRRRIRGAERRAGKRREKNDENVPVHKTSRVNGLADCDLIRGGTLPVLSDGTASVRSQLLPMEKSYRSMSPIKMPESRSRTSIKPHSSEKGPGKPHANARGFPREPTAVEGPGLDEGVHVEHLT